MSELEKEGGSEGEWGREQTRRQSRETTQGRKQDWQGDGGRKGVDRWAKWRRKEAVRVNGEKKRGGGAGTRDREERRADRWWKKSKVSERFGEGRREC